MLTLRMAWRNIWRNRRRSLLTLLAISFAAAVLVFFIGLQLSSYDVSIRASIGLFHGTHQVQREGYLERSRVRDVVPRVTELREKIEAIAGVKAASARGIGFSLVSSGTRTFGTQVVGVEVEREGAVSTIPGLVKEGRFFSDNNAYEAILGKLLARNLQVKIGDELTFLGQGRDGSLAAAVVTLVGIFDSGSNELDRALIEMPLGAFGEVFSMRSSGHSVVVVGEDVNQVGELQQSIQGALPEGENLVVLRWDELLPGLKQSIELDMASGWLFWISLILIVSFSILNTFLMSVLERTKEFGVLLSLGQKPAGISKLIVLECLLLTGLSLLIGIALGCGVLGYFWVHGFSIPGTEQFAAEWNMPNIIYTRITWQSLTWGPGIILIASFLSALYPALRVLWLKPTEALRAT